MKKIINITFDKINTTLILKYLFFTKRDIYFRTNRVVNYYHK